MPPSDERGALASQGGGRDNAKQTGREISPSASCADYSLAFRKESSGTIPEKLTRGNIYKSYNSDSTFFIQKFNTERCLLFWDTGLRPGYWTHRSNT